MVRRDATDSQKTLVETIGARNSVTHRKNTGGPSTSVSTYHAPRDLDRDVWGAVMGEQNDRVHITQSVMNTHVEAILWTGCRLAEGLYHAHERGILHRDLKPANVLMADDGQPMLLGFQLIGRTITNGGRFPVEFMGGTLPYMAPENLQAYQPGTVAGDVRSDVYSLGVILFELLTGASTRFRRLQIAGGREALPQMLADRRGVVPSVRRSSKLVSPAVESIVQKCLAPDPERRYASAINYAKISIVN